MRIFITGSADGLGALAAEALITAGHRVVLHARTTQRADEAWKRIPHAENVLTGDLSDLEQTRDVADQVNQSGSFDAVIHNAGVYQVASKTIFAVNTLAPYILTCLIERPERLIYLSSGMHLHGKPNIESFNKEARGISYSDSKLHVVMLALAAARRWPNVYSNALDPGWVPTKMGGQGAPDDLQQGYETQAWLASSNDTAARVSGRYFYHRKQRAHNPLAANVALQEQLLTECEKITGVAFPEK